MKALHVATTLLLSSASLFGGGLNIYEFANPTAVGTAGAGLGAQARNASTVFENPAGMTYIKQTQIESGMTMMYLHLPFETDGQNTVSGKDGDSSEVFAAANFAFVQPIDDKWSFGVSAHNYLGLTLDWQDNWAGRYTTTEEWIIAPQLQPTVAYKVNDWLSVGIGAAFTVGYMKVKLVSPITQNNLELTDTAYALQGNFGVMIQANDDLRFGVRYLSESKLDFTSSLSGSNLNKDLDLGIYMPQCLTISSAYTLNDQWTILADLGWEDWSRFGKIEVGFSGIGEVTTTDIKAKDVYHFGIASQYQYNSKLMLSAGFSYDSTLFNDDERPLGLPIGEMYRYGVGFEKEISDDFSIGSGIDLLWQGNVPAARSDVSNGQGTLSGEHTDVYFIFTSIYGIWKF